jgi:lysine/ornithine N-monooxygenase
MKNLLLILLVFISGTLYAQRINTNKISDKCIKEILDVFPEGLVIYTDDCWIKMDPEYDGISTYDELNEIENQIYEEFRISIDFYKNATKEQRIQSCYNVIALADDYTAKAPDFWIPIKNKLAQLKCGVCKKSEKKTMFISCLEECIDTKLRRNYENYRKRAPKILKELGAN